MTTLHLKTLEADIQLLGGRGSPVGLVTLVKLDDKNYEIGKIALCSRNKFIRIFGLLLLADEIRDYGNK